MSVPLTTEQVEACLEILEVMEEALEGDGSTGTMPDVSPADAAKWIYSALTAKGYVIFKVRES